MNDTSPEFQAEYDRQLMARTGSERLRMMSDAFNASKRLALAGLRAEGGGDLRARLFLRLHGDSFGEQMTQRILVYLRECDQKEPLK